MCEFLWLSFILSEGILQNIIQDSKDQSVPLKKLMDDFNSNYKSNIQLEPEIEGIYQAISTTYEA